MPSQIIQLRTLGTAEIDIGSVQIRPNAPRRFAALLYLCAEAGRRIPRRVLIDLLFPDKSERNGLHSLRELLYELRTAGVPLESDPDGVELPCSAVYCEHTAMLENERLTLEQIRGAQHGFLPGYSPDHSEAYTEWYDAFHAKTTFALSQALLRSQARARNTGNLELSEAAARACLAISPLNEHAVRALAETIALGGAVADAERLLDEYAAEVGSRSPYLKLSAESLRRHMAERLPERYRHAGELPFLGRDAEMLELRRRFVSSRRGLTECAVIVGEPGIGKTRLASEFAALAALDDSEVARVTAQPHDSGRPMGLFIDLVPGLLRLRGALGIAPESMDALQRLTTTSAPGGLVDSQRNEPAILSRAITDALDDLFSAVTGETHLTLLIEDAHWADGLSLRVLAEIARKGERRLFVLLTSRERRLHDLGDRFAEEAGFLALGPLEQGLSEELLQRALRGTSGEHHCKLHDWMADVANGNPFFISLLVTHFLATGAPFAVPPSLQELIGRRLESLDSAATIILQTCVLLGSMANLARLTASLDLELLDAVAGIARLDAMHMIKWIDGKLAPVHSLLADALIQRSSAISMRVLHRRIAEVLETELAKAESATTLWNCAEHWVAAGDHDVAFGLLQKCAEHARDIGRPGAAAEILLRVASLQIDTGARTAALQDAIRLAALGREHDLVLHGISHLRMIDPLLHLDDIELAELHSLSTTHRDSTDYEWRVLAYLESGTASAEHRVRAGLAALQYADTHARPELALRVSAAVSEADLSAVDSVLALEFKLVFHAAFGDVAESRRIARTLQDLGDVIPGARGAGLHFNAVIALLHTGADEGAYEGCKRAYELGRQCGAVKLQLSAAVQIAIILVEQGRFEDSLPWRERIQSLMEENSRLQDGFEAYVHEIDFCLLEGNFVRAEAVFRRCEELGVFASPSRQRWRRCLNARLRQLSGGPSLSPHEIAEFIREGNTSIPPTGVRDVEIAVICAALVDQGDRDAAQQVLSDFLERKAASSRASVATHLRHAIAMYSLE